VLTPWKENSVVATRRRESIIELLKLNSTVSDRKISARTDVVPVTVGFLPPVTSSPTLEASKDAAALSRKFCGAHVTVKNPYS
jgi:hypothetical protein